jgi:dephospho-CoA kinase
MKIVGLTGGIGSGKTTVSHLLAVYGIPVYDSDSRSKVLCQTDADLIAGLKQLFGDSVYLPDGSLNKPFMAKALFEDKTLLQASNGLIHPVVGRDFAHWAGLQDAPFVVQETAILFEAGLQDRYDVVVCVTAPETVRLNRACAGGRFRREDVLARMRNQWSDAERVRRSDFELVNDETTALLPQVEALLKKIS